jgi:hypothetical protein
MDEQFSIAAFHPQGSVLQIGILVAIAEKYAFSI